MAKSAIQCQTHQYNTPQEFFAEADPITWAAGEGSSAPNIKSLTTKLSDKLVESLLTGKPLPCVENWWCTRKGIMEAHNDRV